MLEAGRHLTDDAAGDFRRDDALQAATGLDGYLVFLGAQQHHNTIVFIALAHAPGGAEGAAVIGHVAAAQCGHGHDNYLGAGVLSIAAQAVVQLFDIGRLHELGLIVHELERRGSGRHFIGLGQRGLHQSSRDK